jgi:hypothetical protein
MSGPKRKYIKKSTDLADVFDWLPQLPEEFRYIQTAQLVNKERPYLVAGWTIYYRSRALDVEIPHHSSLFTTWGITSYDLISALLKAAWRLSEFWFRYELEDHFRLAEAMARLYAEDKGFRSRREEILVALGQTEPEELLCGRPNDKEMS